MYLSFTQILKQLPFIRLILPFILGIIFQIRFSIETNYYPYLIILLLIIFILLNKANHSSSAFKNRFLPGVIINVLIFLTGALLLSVNTKNNFEYIGEEIIAEAIITEPATEKSNSYKAVITLKNYYLNNRYYSSDEDIIVYLEKSEPAKALEYGDKILFKSIINEVRTSGNPNEFNYQEFLLRKGIVGQTYIKAKNWQLKAKDEGLFIFSFAFKARNTLAGIYKKFHISGQELAVLQALTLGDKSELDTETRQSYVSSGAMHILAVSGLHVGILYFLFNFFLKILDKLKYRNINYGSWLKAVIIISLLWAFALLSGLSPSVRRAAVMFTFVILGQAMKRRIDIYNSLAASAFVLLIIDPYQITSVGFQLSYCAVLSIIFFQPKIADLFVIKNKILYYIWSLTAVSIAAQIGTFPFSLYYFNIFPNLFFITNIFVIPLATGIIYAAVFLLIFSAIPFVSNVFAYILKYLVIALNSSVELVERIPFSHTENIPFSSFDIVFAYSLIISISFYLIYKNARSLQLSLAIVAVWISINSIFKIYVNSNPELIVYNIKGETAINISGKNNYLISDSTILNDQKIKYGPMNHWLHRGKADYEFIELSLTEFNNNGLYKTGNYLLFYNKALLIINDRKQILYQTNNKLNIDYIILSKNTEVNISEVKNLYDVKLIIFDSSNNFYKVEQWKNECAELNQKCYSVIKNGAFIKEL